MSADRIIADSDDDDFSPVPSPVRIVASSGGGSIPGSSDPGFFRSEFLAHQDAAAYEPKSTADTPSDRLANGGEPVTQRAAKGDTYEPWAILSSPDPVRTVPKTKSSTRPRASKTYSTNGGLGSRSAVSPSNAASITTPKAKNTTPSKSSRTYSKKDSGAKVSASSPRHVIDLVSPDQHNTIRPTGKAAKHDVDEANGECRDGSPRRARKKKKKRISDLRVGSAGSLGEEVVDIPSSYGAPDTSMGPPARRNANDGPSGDPEYFYVEPSRMSASEQGQYEEVSFPLLSSLDEPDLRQFTHLARSSGSATIAYPTPTQYRHPDPTSMLPLPRNSSPAESRKGSKRRRLSSLPPTADYPGSSPDVFAGAPDMNELQPKEDAEPPIMEQDNSCDEDWNEMDHGFPRPQERQPPRTKKHQRAAKQESTEIQDDCTETAGYVDHAEAQAGVVHQPVPKKRGRKKKDKVSDPELVTPAAEKTQNTEDAPPQKRKRGRPRKSDKPSGADDVPAKAPELPELGHGLETLHDIEDGSGEAGCHGTYAKECDEQDNKETAEVDGKKELRDADVPPKRSSVPANTGQGVDKISAVALSNASAGNGGAADERGERATKTHEDTMGKAGRLPRPGAKPVYRVGLSKRSRITPLLKCIRKS